MESISSQSLNLLPDAETILIKFGSNVISKNHRLDYAWLRMKVREMANLIRKGKNIILISSGAVAAGMEERNVKAKPADSFSMQVLSGIGQPRLIKLYRDFFRRHRLSVAQMLVTHHNFQTPRERLNIQRIINHYLANKVVPVINTNDIITNEELMRKATVKFSDNDQLAALVAMNLNVDLLLIITNVEGLYTANPRKGHNSQIIGVVPKVTRAVEQMASTGKSDLGAGGMLSKVRAAKDVTGVGIPTIIAGGQYPLEKILMNKVPRTLFLARGM